MGDTHEPSAADSPLQILYQDTRYAAIHKPSGLLVHRSPIDWRETQFAIQLLRDQLGQRVHPVHRLDRPTSGVLLFALDEEAMVAMKKAFESRRVEKTYLAVTRGHAPQKGTIDYPLRKFLDADARKKSEEAQEAATEYTRLATSELPYPTDRYASTRYSLVQLHPLTGRRHQLRRHLAHLNYPIVGDTRYGDNKLNKSAREGSGIGRLMLAAVALRFEHPFSRVPIEIHCPLAPKFLSGLAKLDLSCQEWGIGCGASAESFPSFQRP